MKKYLKGLLKQPSTYKGLALLVGSALSAGGATELLNIDVPNVGEPQFGGAIATLGMLALGAWETIRNEKKGR
ncbi:hypothetical protein [Enterovibrio norvegicus]|uniref:hypothetical protein n=1 Tax=Enterovibrio norvegicus TaxID=188144 RepID=UPI0035517ED1